MHTDQAVMEFDIIYSIIFWNCANGLDMTLVVGVSVIFGYVGGVPVDGARFAHTVSDTCKTGRLIHVHLYVTTPLCGQPCTGKH